jgi:hypothetical protein
MAEKKITKREVINTMLADENVKGNEMYVAYLQNELALLDKKAQKKVNAQETEEVSAMKSAIMETLANMGKVTVTELQLADERISVTKYSNQKVTSVLGKLKADGKVDSVKEKGKTLYFTV